MPPRKKKKQQGNNTKKTSEPTSDVGSPRPSETDAEDVSEADTPQGKDGPKDADDQQEAAPSPAPAKEPPPQDRKRVADPLPEPMDVVAKEADESSTAGPSGNKEAGKTEKKKDEPEVELSEEDKALKEKLEGLVSLVLETRKPGEQKTALLEMGKEVAQATSSMTAVPKPLKFLRPHFESLKTLYASMDQGHPNRVTFADLLSVLAMTSGGTEREVLTYKLQGTQQDLGQKWGHEYIRSITAEIGGEYAQRESDGKDVEDLLALVRDIIPFNTEHHAESEACDLLVEVGRLPWILDYVNEENYRKITAYLTQLAQYVPEPEDTATFQVVYEILRKMNNLPLALRMAMKMNRKDLIEETYNATDDAALKKQLALMIAPQNHWIESEGDSDMQRMMGNLLMCEHFQLLAKDLDIREAKTPDDVYKSHLETVSKAAAPANVDSARKNLASTFVNALVNAGFGSDKLMTLPDSDWVYKNKEHGMMSAVASLGMVKQWDFDALSDVDKFTHSEEPYIVGGAMLAIGLVCAGIRTNMNAALSLMEEHLEKDNAAIKAGVLIGGAIAEAGHENEDAIRMFQPLLAESSTPIEVCALAALSLGIIFVGSGNEDIAFAITSAIDERAGSPDIKSVHGKLLCLALGLLFLGKQKNVSEVVMTVVEALPESIQKVAKVTLNVCAYTGTGNVLQIQSMLHLLTDHLPEGEGAHQSIGVLGVALIALGEDLGLQMALRSFNHILQYGEVEQRRSVPLALGLLCPSDPKMMVVDTLSKLSHDADAEVSQNAVLGLGLVGAGSNNSRIAAMLRELAAYYSKEPNHLFVVRIAQGLLYMGKGTITLNPYNSDKLLQRNVALAGLMSVTFACLDMKTTILGKAHYMLYLFSLAMRTRMLMTFDENLQQVKVPVRVGEAVDTVGQAGKPKTITGFQTHDTPVLLDIGQRAELVNDQYIALTPILEGAVIVRKNPDFEEGQHH